MNTRENINTEKIKRLNTVFPHAVKTGGYIFLSGMAGLDPGSGQVVNNQFEDQAMQCFLNIKTVLEAAGSDMSRIVKTTIFMVSGNDFGIINKVYAHFFPENAPARSVPQVMPFPAGILISVECIALV